MNHDPTTIAAMIANRPQPITNDAEAESVMDTIRYLQAQPPSNLIAAEITRQEGRLHTYDFNVRHGCVPTRERTIVPAADPSAYAPYDEDAPPYRTTPTRLPSDDDRKAEALAGLKEQHRNAAIKHRVECDAGMPSVPSHITDPEKKSLRMAQNPTALLGGPVRKRV
jgi:hypothetical protein